MRGLTGFDLRGLRQVHHLEHVEARGLGAVAEAGVRLALPRRAAEALPVVFLRVTRAAPQPQAAQVLRSEGRAEVLADVQACRNRFRADFRPPFLLP